MIFVDGVDVGDIEDVALRDRRMLSADGIFIVVATISGQDGRSVAPPEIIFRGVPFLDEADGLVEEIREAVETSLDARGRGGDARDRPAPGAPARRRGGVRLRAPAPPADGAAGGRGGLALEHHVPVEGARAGARARVARDRPKSPVSPCAAGRGEQRDAAARPAPSRSPSRWAIGHRARPAGVARTSTAARCRRGARLGLDAQQGRRVPPPVCDAGRGQGERPVGEERRRRGALGERACGRTSSAQASAAALSAAVARRHLARGSTPRCPRR